MPEPSSTAADQSPAPSSVEADYRRLFTLSQDLLCIAGMDGYFKQVNPSWTRVLGWSEADLLSRPIEDFMHPEDRVRTLQARASLARGTPVRGLENRYLCKDGSYRWLSWQSTAEPATATVFAVARDITERRQLDHEQLIMSKLESTGILAGGIAHDFNNLLAGVLMNLDLVAMLGATSDQQKQHLRHAQQTVHAAKALTDQLLTFAEGGITDRRVIDLIPLLRQSLEVALQGSTIKSECVLAPDLWRVEANEAQINQITRNLILNAREASLDSAPIRLQADNVVCPTPNTASLPSGAYVRIIVMDKGSGIAPDILPKVFDPYYSTKQRGTQKGMGLGLTICRTVLQKHGGTIVLDSLPGLGTTATCHLPAYRPAR